MSSSCESICPPRLQWRRADKANKPAPVHTAQRQPKAEGHPTSRRRFTRRSASPKQGATPQARRRFTRRAITKSLPTSKSPTRPGRYGQQKFVSAPAARSRRPAAYSRTQRRRRRSRWGAAGLLLDPRSTTHTKRPAITAGLFACVVETRRIELLSDNAAPQTSPSAVLVWYLEQLPYKYKLDCSSLLGSLLGFQAPP